MCIFMEAGRWVCPMEVISKQCHSRQRKVRVEIRERHHGAVVREVPLKLGLDIYSSGEGDRNN